MLVEIQHSLNYKYYIFIINLIIKISNSSIIPHIVLLYYNTNLLMFIKMKYNIVSLTNSIK